MATDWRSLRRARSNAEGRPRYVDVTGPDNALGLTQPEIYFGDGLDSYAIVGTNRAGGEETLDPAKPAYTGDGGVELSSRLRRAAFAVHFGEYNLFGSKLINDELADHLSPRRPRAGSASWHRSCASTPTRTR